MAIIIVHWFADFVCQTDLQAKNKSKDWGYLLAHTLNYSLVWLLIIGVLVLVNFLPYIFFWFVPITFVAHTATDYFTSRLNTKLWGQGRVHDFFVSVGFDQVLHYFQLFATFLYLLHLAIP